MVAALVVLLQIVGRAAGGGIETLAGVPATLRPFDLLRLLEDEGAVDAALWPAFDSAMFEHMERTERELDPKLLAIEEATGRQHWFNWPFQKPPKDRALRDAAIDAVRSTEAALFGRLAELLPERAERFERAHAARIRSSTPYATCVPHRVPFDLIGAVRDSDLSLEERERVKPILDRWAPLDAASRSAAMKACRAAMETFESKLLSIGVVIDRDAETRGEWLPKAWDLWCESTRDLVQIVDAAVLEIDRRIEEIASHLEEERAALFRQNLLDRRTRLWRYGAPSPPSGEFAAILRSGECSGAEAEEVRAIRRRWLAKEVPLLRRAVAIARDGSAPFWLLTGGGWSDPDQEGPVEAALGELDRERQANDTVARDALRAALGDRLDPLVHAGSQALETERVRRRAPERWDPSPFAPAFRPNDDSLHLHFDHGPLSRASADGIADALALDDAARTAWTAVIDANIASAVAAVADARGTPNAPQTHRFAWSFSDAGYVYNAAGAQELIRRSLAQRDLIRSLDAKAFTELAALAPASPSRRTRLAIESSLRAIEFARDVFRSEPRQEDDRRDLVSPTGLVRRALDPTVAGRDAAERLASALEPPLKALAARWSERGSELAPVLARVFELVERRMWAKEPERGALDRQLADVRRELAERDEPYRASIRSATRALVDQLIVERPDDALALDEMWRSEAFPSLFAQVPPAWNVLARTRTSQQRDSAIAALDATWISRDQALCEALIVHALAQPVGDGPTGWPERRRLADRRQFVSELALVGLRILKPVATTASTAPPPA